MKLQRLLLTLTVINLGLLVFLLMSTAGHATANSEAPVLRGRALEIVDAQGRVRASLAIQPPTPQPNGETTAETVLLRLITERGRPSVKIEASEQSSGLGFSGTTGTRDTYVILQAGGRVSSLKLRNEDTREILLKP